MKHVYVLHYLVVVYRLHIIVVNADSRENPLHIYRFSSFFLTMNQSTNTLIFIEVQIKMKVIEILNAMCEH